MRMIQPAFKRHAEDFVQIGDDRAEQKTPLPHDAEKAHRDGTAQHGHAARTPPSMASSAAVIGSAEVNAGISKFESFIMAYSLYCMQVMRSPRRPALIVAPALCGTTAPGYSIIAQI